MAIGGNRIIPGNVAGDGGTPSGALPFAASVELWTYELTVPDSQWSPVGLFDLTGMIRAQARRYQNYVVVTLNRGTQWGDVVVTITAIGAGAWSLGPQPSSVTIAANQSQAEFQVLLNQNVVGESVLEVQVSDGTYEITRKATIIISAAVVSGGYYGGYGLGEDLI